MNSLKKIISLSFIMILIVGKSAFSQEQQYVSLIDHQVALDELQQYHLTLMFEIKSQYHIQANEVNDEYLIPSAITFDSNDNLKVVSISYSPSKELTIIGYDKPFYVFSDFVKVEVVIGKKDNKKMDHPLTGEFFYQACLGTKCFYPRAMKFKVDLDTTTLSVDRSLR